MLFDGKKCRRMAGLLCPIFALDKTKAESGHAIDRINEEVSSSLYEMVPFNVSFDDLERRLSDRVVFYAMGDVPYGATQKKRLPYQIQALESRAEFVVH